MTERTTAQFPSSIASMIDDPWTQQHLTPLPRPMGIGDNEPPPLRPFPWQAAVGWGIVLATAAGLFYAVAGPASERRGVRRNAISERQRARLPQSVFVFPERRAWPLDSASRAYDAIRMLRLGRVASASDFAEIRNAIRRKFPNVWSKYGKGLSWDVIQRAKFKARRSRARTKLRSAANAKKAVSRKPNKKGNKKSSKKVSQKVGGKVGKKTASKMTLSRAMSLPVAKTSKPKFSDLGALMAVATIRTQSTLRKADVLPPGVSAKFKRMPAGIYKYGWGPKKGESITRFTTPSLKGAITATRIGAKSVGEYHWVVDNFVPAFPVVIRGIDDRGRTIFRVEEFARQFARPTAQMLQTKRSSSRGK